jgi:hypothetical protein
MSNVIPIKGPRARRQKCRQITTVEQINKANTAFWATPEANATARSIAELQSAVAVAYGTERARRMKQSGAGAAATRELGLKSREKVRVAALKRMAEQPEARRDDIAQDICGSLGLSFDTTVQHIKKLGLFAKGKYK